MPEKIKGYSMVVAGGFFWGSGFLFIQYILDSGLAPKDMIFWKMIIGFAFLFSYTYFKDKNLLKIDRKGLMACVLMAVVCHVLYNFFMNSAVDKTGAPTTVSLMYTAPIFVLIISKFAFKESLTPWKITAVGVSVVGVFLISTGGNLDTLSFDAVGISYGLATGLSYAMMNLISKALLCNHKQVTILTYTFGLAAVFSLVISNPAAAFEVNGDLWFWLNILGLGFVPTVLGYFCFTTGLSYNIESSKASIIAAIEVPVTVVGSWLVFSDPILGLKSVGILLILISVVLIHRDDLKAEKAKMALEEAAEAEPIPDKNSFESD